MFFKPEMIEAMLRKKNPKTQTRRLVKEGESLVLTTDKKSLKEYNEGKEISNPDPQTWSEVRTNKGKIKWRVGQDYSVQPGRGKKGVWWIPKKKKWYYSPLDSVDKKGGWRPYYHYNFPHGKVKFNRVDDCFEFKEFYPKVPLRIRITSIRKEKLLEITELEAEKEGFKNKAYFVDYIYHLYGKLKKDEDLLWMIMKGKKQWNPEVWVLGFEVVK